MKNVAKCDTWCELQNPVNHRVFERKLRPKPFWSRARLPGRHTQRRPPPMHLDGGGNWPPEPLGARSAQMLALGGERRGQRWLYSHPPKTK